MPWITVWDDHEFANNAYVDGAQNHDPLTQGAWSTRKAIAAQVYHEWMPIRTDKHQFTKDFTGKFDFGSLFTSSYGRHSYRRKNKTSIWLVWRSI
jgi:alkaline phosphatase D